jgi:tetratricopeptide (TPR) repeat protein
MMPAQKSLEARVDKLADRGYACVQHWDYKRAIKCGKKLLKLRHTSGFEILALAYAGKGKKKKAIRILEKGVRKGPGVWLLWQLLGNYYSDRKKFKKAQIAYEKALECEHTDTASVNFNHAIVFDRQGQYQEALSALEIPEETRLLSYRVQSLKALILQQLERNEEALQIASQTQQQLLTLDKEFVDDNAEELSIVWYQLGNVYWQAAQDEENALKCASYSLALRRNETEALTLIRNIENRRTPQAKYYRLLIEGDWPEEIEDKKARLRPAGFFTTYDVVADSKEEAFTYVCGFEPEEMRDSLKIEECEVLEKRPDGPKGVYRITGYGIFSRKPKDK